MPRRLSKMACWRDLPRHERDTGSATQRNFYIFGNMVKLKPDAKTP